MIHTGDCVDVMRTLPDASVDAVVTDPPYGLEFMGKDWDRLGTGDGAVIHDPAMERGGFQDGNGGNPYSRSRIEYGRRDPAAMQAWHLQWATEAFRVLKPGGYLLAFGGTRTVHRLASAIEDAGFEIRDELVWIYASGFPKSLDVSKALDKIAGAERDLPRHEGWTPVPGGATNICDTCGKSKGGASGNCHCDKNGQPATDLARQWRGWGTALKPAHEPIVMARKPLVGTVAGNVTKYGTGAINVDATRIPGAEPYVYPTGPKGSVDPTSINLPRIDGERVESHPAGRWPSNILLSDPELFDQPNPYVVGSGATEVGGGYGSRGNYSEPRGWGFKGDGEQVGYGDSGGYSRFFIIPKADRAEREPVLRGHGLEERVIETQGKAEGWTADENGGHLTGDNRKPRTNVHPTVKPVDLMRHLVRLVTPPGGTVLDPFLGSGTTAIACELEGFGWIGIEKEPEYVAIAEARLNGTQRGLGI